MACGPYRRWSHRHSSLVDVVMLKEEIEEAYQKASDLQSDIKKKNKELSKVKKNP